MQHLDDLAAPGTDERILLEQVDLSRLPRHIAFIMDGNGRWAKARKLPRVEGHRHGIRAVRQTVEACARLGVEHVTLYAFSTENWKRPRLEVRTLMNLLKEYLSREIDTFVENNMRLRTIGHVHQLDDGVKKELKKALTRTSACTGMLVQVALNYSGRQELTDLIRQAAQQAARHELDEASITEAWVDEHLATAGVPDPDLLVRTSGEQRISNFLLWQLAYSEIYFCPVMWPDFCLLELLRAIVEFQKRERRFGGLPDENQGVFSPVGDLHAQT